MTNEHRWFTVSAYVPCDLEKIFQHESCDTHVAEECFYIKFSFLIQHIYLHQYT